MSEDVHHDKPLTRIEHHHAFRSDRTPSREVSEDLTKRLSQDQDLYTTVSTNPYSPEAQARLQKEFPDVDASYYARSVILAEPEAEYDKRFHAASLEDKREMLYEQIDSSADISVRLSQHIQDQAESFWNLSQEELFEKLSEVAFNTKDKKEVDERYALSQRRGFRLALTNFIEDLHIFKSYKESVKESPKKTVESILGQQLTKDFSIDILPYGVVILLDEEDFNQSVGNNEDVHRHGTVLHETAVPDLYNRVVLFSKKSDENLEIDKLQQTRNHEIKHLIYNNYFADSPPEIPSGLSVENPDLANFLNKMVKHHAKDEMLAYVANDSFHPDMHQLGFNNFDIYYKGAFDSIQSLDISSAQKNEMIAIYKRSLQKGYKQMRTYQWIQQKLYEAAEDNVNGLSHDKVEALMRLTSIENVQRLSKYLEMSPKEVTESEANDEHELEMHYSHLLTETLQKHQMANPDIFSKPDTWNNEMGEFSQFVSNYPESGARVLLQLMPLAENIYVKVYLNSYMSSIIETSGYILPDTTVTHIKDTLHEYFAQNTEGANEVVANMAKQTITQIDKLDNPFN